MSGPLDNTNAVRTGNNSSPGDGDKKAVSRDARNGGKPAGQSFRIGDPLQSGVEEPVPAIRDESMAVRLLAQERRSRTSALGRGRFDGAAGCRSAERGDLDRQRKAPEACD